MNDEPSKLSRRASIAGVALAIVALGIGVAGTASHASSGFTENVGQLGVEVLYHARGSGASVYLTREGPVIDLFELRRDAASEAGIHAAPARSRDRRSGYPSARYSLAVRFAASTAPVRVEGVDELRQTHRFVTGAKGGFRTSGARVFAEVIYRAVWPGIDVAYLIGQDGALVYEIIAAPGSDPSRVAFTYDGGSVTRASATSWIVETPLGTVRDARQASTAGVGQLTFERAGAGPVTAATEGVSTDGAHWSTLLGGSLDEEIYGVTIDAEDRPIVTGVVRSADFPTTTGVLDTSANGSFDAFVSKFTADGTGLLWSTFLGGDDDDRGWAIRLDSEGRPVVAGATKSEDFPTSAGAYDTSHNGGFDAFVTKLSADGSQVVWSTLFGGNDWEFDISGIALDSGGRPVIAGSTESTDLPTTAGAWDTTIGGSQDAFVARFSADGTSLDWSTFLGGSDADVGEDVALTAQDRPVVVGRTYSDDFPTSVGAFQTALAGTGATQDAFVVWLAADGTGIDASTYLGGVANDEGYGVVTHKEAAIVTGYSVSTDFPTTPGSLYPNYRGAGDAFVTKIAADATALDWSTYLGGTAGDRGLDIAADIGGRASIVGWTCASNFPTAGSPFDSTYNGICDAYVARLTADGSALQYGSFLGGYTDDSAYAVELDRHDRFLVGGRTLSPDFPTSAGAYDSEHASPEFWEDAFLAWLAPPRFCSTVATDGSLTVGDLPPGGCTPGTPSVEAIDIIEGRLEALNPADIGDVWQIACDTTEVTFESGTVPPKGFGYFQLARVGGGAYTDGGGATLVGARVPLSGDCP